jgi:hypothetical protein
VAGHEVYAASALSVVAAVLLARWFLAGRRGRLRIAGVSRRALRRTALRDGRRTGCAGALTGQGWPREVACAQRAVREAEDLVQGYWRRLSPLYLFQRDHGQH